METDIDADLLIDEVEKRAMLWDLENPDYKNRATKRACWGDLVEVFGNIDDTPEKKKMLGAMLQKKWKSLRDNFARELKRQKSPLAGSRTTNHAPYVHFARMLFLENSVTHKESTSNIDPNTVKPETDEDESAELDLRPHLMREPLSLTLSNVNKQIKLNPVDQQVSDVTKSAARKENRETEQDKEDDDKLFCLSLYKELMKVPERGRINAKIQILEVIQRAQQF